MNTDHAKHPGILELVSQGNFGAAATVLKLVDQGGLKPHQIASVFMAVTEGTRAARASKDIRAVIFECLLKTSAFKLELSDVVEFKREFTRAHRNPDLTRVEKLESLGIGAAALMDEHRFGSHSLIEVAEAVADGLEATRNRARISVMDDGIAAHLGKKLPNDEQRVYESVFALAAMPSSSKDCVFNIILTAYARRAESGTIALEPTVVRRIKRMLPQTEAKPLSDGDTKLPNPMRRPVAHAVNNARRTAAIRMNLQ